MSSMPAVKAIFLRMSATWKAFRIVASMGLSAPGTQARRAWRGAADSSGCDGESRPVHGPELLALDELAAAAGSLYALARARAEAVRVDRERLAELALGQHLDRHALAGGQAVGLHQLDRDLRARLEATLERRDVHGLGVRAEGLEGHRLLHVRAAQLSHAHVDRHLAPLEGGPALGARARARALLPTSGGLARARPFSTPDALTRAPAPGSRREAVQPDAVRPALLGGGAHLPSLTSTRWRTACSMPRACSVSSSCTV